MPASRKPQTKKSPRKAPAPAGRPGNGSRAAPARLPARRTGGTARAVAASTRPSSAILRRRRERIAAILPILKQTYPHARCSLQHSNPLELIVATILSAQCTDERVNLTTPALFERFPTARDYADAPPRRIEKLIQSCGFFRTKTKSIQAMASSLIEKHGGEVPRSMEELTALAGVGRKTANVVLGNAFGINVGVTVDTHVARLSQRLGLTSHADPARIEQDLMAIVPQEQWTDWSHLLIHHGRAICTARSPKCPKCPLLAHCPTGRKNVG